MCERRLCVAHEESDGHRCPREGVDEYYYPALRASNTSFADALDRRKGRSDDLAYYVRNGKAYQRLPFLIGDYLDSQYFTIFQALRSLVLEETMSREASLPFARQKFSGEAGLKGLQRL